MYSTWAKDRMRTACLDLPRKEVLEQTTYLHLSARFFPVLLADLQRMLAEIAVELLQTLEDPLRLARSNRSPALLREQVHPCLVRNGDDARVAQAPLH